MDGIYPLNNCCNQQLTFNENNNNYGQKWTSSTYIRNRGQVSSATAPYYTSPPDYEINNTPASQIYVQVSTSKKDTSKLVYWLNGYESPRLVLKRNKKYQINVNSKGFPFYLTTDSIGGKDLLGKITDVPPTDYFVHTYYINNELPNNFYYQCSLYPDMGGEVVIIE